CRSSVRMTMHEVVHEMVVGECHEPNSEGSGSAWKAYMNARVAGLFLLVLLEYPNGSNSESYEQNFRHSFDMAFGGGGFAISRSLAKVLASVLDSCLMRYPHVYGSDSRVYSCLVELGVELTNEPGFHQVDVRGDMFGILAAHPLSPLLSLHHFDIIDPIFPGFTKLEAVKHLMKAVKHDPAKILQQTVCYSSSSSITVSVSWGYAVQDYRKDSCNNSDVFFFEGVVPDGKRSYTFYKRHVSSNCPRSNGIQDLMNIKVFSGKLDADAERMTPSRRQCCEILQPYSETMIIALRRCETDELIAMHT
nr:hypothetical protein [Tanacetum cinerariifolium]